jgi:hypothetical protein
MVCSKCCLVCYCWCMSSLIAANARNSDLDNTLHTKIIAVVTYISEELLALGLM